MKIFLIILFTLGSITVQESGPQAFERDFNEIADAFERDLVPYLYKFADLQERPLADSASEPEKIVRARLVESSVNLFKDKAREIRTNSNGALRARGFNLNYTAKQKNLIVEDFNFMYRITFLFLDYRYYDKLNKELKIKAK